MGFTPLAGITMSTRSGDVDPSLLQYVMDKENMSIDEMMKSLNNKSGYVNIFVSTATNPVKFFY